MRMETEEGLIGNQTSVEKSAARRRAGRRRKPLRTASKRTSRGDEIGSLGGSAGRRREEVERWRMADAAAEREVRVGKKGR